MNEIDNIIKILFPSVILCRWEEGRGVVVGARGVRVVLGRGEARPKRRGRTYGVMDGLGLT